MSNDFVWLRRVAGTLVMTVSLAAPIAVVALMEIATRNTYRDELATVVPLEAILVHPQNYVGRRMHVFGYLSMGAGVALFLSDAHAENADSVSSIPLGGIKESARYFALVDGPCMSHYTHVTGLLTWDHDSYALTEPLRVTCFIDGEFHEVLSDEADNQNVER